MNTPSVKFATASISALSDSSVRSSLEWILAESIVRYRWFGGKARTIQSLSMVEVVPITVEHGFVLLKVGYLGGESDEYLMPLSLATGAAAEQVLAGGAAQCVARVEIADREEAAVLCDSMTDERAAGLFLDMVRDERELAGQHGQIVCRRTGRFAELCTAPADSRAQNDDPQERAEQ